jgi:hypothetical protein
VKVFWSWQSDTPGKVGRHFVREALELSIAQLKEAPDIEEPSEREAREALHVDHDRKGVSGSPRLADTIFDKISASEVVIADVTPVGKVPKLPGSPKRTKAKKIINPNVAIEVGYALHASPRKEKSLLMVLNEHYGSRADIPFDLQPNAGPIMYRLAPDASKDEIKRVQAELAGRLKSAIAPFLANPAALAGANPTPAFVETHAKGSAGTWFNAHEILASVGEEDDRIEYRFDTLSGIYLRVIPTARLAAPIALATLNDCLLRSSTLQPLQSQGSAYFRQINPYGAIAFEPGRTNIMRSATQLFQNGEIWGFNAHLLTQQDAAGKILLPSQAIERTFQVQLPRYLGFARDELGIPPSYTLELGMTGVKDANIAMPNQFTWGPIHQPALAHRVIVNSLDAKVLSGVLLAFFEKIYDLTGYSRPAHLYGFPSPP